MRTHEQSAKPGAEPATSQAGATPGKQTLVEDSGEAPEAAAGGSQGTLRGEWGSVAAVAAGFVVGGPIGAAGVLAYQASHKKDEAKPDAAKPADPAKPDKPAPTMTSSTLATPASGALPTREVVGVGEVMTFTGSEPGTWTADGGTFTPNPAPSASFVWQAPGSPRDFKITLTVDGKSTHKLIKVIAPTIINFTNSGDIQYPRGVQGAGMNLEMDLGPKTVAFGAVKVKEIGGPAHNVRGYFARPGLDLTHYPTEGWTQFDDMNGAGRPDRAEIHGWDQLEDSAGKKIGWSAGELSWSIPHHYTIRGEENASHLMTGVRVTQSLKILDARGTSTVSKGSDGGTVETSRPRRP